MKLAIFSDVHSNSKAFSIAYKDAMEKHGCDSVVCLGDIVGYGPDPIGSIDAVKGKCSFCLLGNHDAGVIGKLRMGWFGETAANVIRKQKPIVSSSKEHYEWLNLLSYTKTLEFGDSDSMVRIQFAHGNNYEPNEFGYISDTMGSCPAFVKMIRDNVDILFVGHTHEPKIFLQPRKDDLDILDNYPTSIAVVRENEFKIDVGSRAIVNVGSVGYPRSCRYSVYCILDTDTLVVKYVFIPFDFEEYSKSLDENGISIPPWLAWRLERVHGAKDLFCRT